MASATESTKLFTEFSEHSAKLEVVLNERKDVDTARALIQELQAMVNAHGALLPARDLQTYRQRIDAYKKQLDKLKAPKKRFAFTKETKDAHADKVCEQEDAADVARRTDAAEVAPVKSESSTAFLIEDKLNVHFEQTEVHGDVELRNIEGCRIAIRGCPNTLYINDVRNSEVICDPVASSVLIVGFTDSSLQVACQQLRIHKAVKATFRLHITSRSIIEECHDVCFGPLPEEYIVSEEKWQKAGLSRLKNNYAAVDDFNWLNTSQPSPNWKLLE